MLKGVLFRLTQMLYVQAAMVLLANFRPKGKSVEQVQGMIGEAKGAKNEYLIRQTALEGGQGAVRTAHAGAHAAAIRVYGLMKETYAENGTHLHKIVRIPKASHSAERTLVRMAKTSEVWDKLPHPPGSAKAFVADAMTKAEFDGLMEGLDGAVKACLTCASEFDGAEGALQGPDAVNRKFIGAALKLGRALFAEGTAGRSIIEGIPTVPATQAPGPAVVLLAASVRGGAGRLEFNAAHATSFEVWHKGPGEAAFALAAEVLRAGAGPAAVYLATGLPDGEHWYKVVGVNSRGAGPASAVASLALPGVNVA